MKVKTCQRCQLSQSCTNIVMSRGNYRYPIVIVGEAPGYYEDDAGVPFVGQAGKMLERVLNSVGIESEDCLVTNMVRCRPPDNRAPTSKELKACYPYLYREIKAAKPDVIVLLGNTPLKFFLGSNCAITNYQGYFIDYTLRSPRGKKYTRLDHYTFLPWFHPAALLRDASLATGGKKWQVWQSAIELSRRLNDG